MEPEELLRGKFMEALLASASSGNRAVAQMCPELGALDAWIACFYALFNGKADLSTRAILARSEPITDGEMDQVERFFLERGAPVRIFIADKSGATQLMDRLAERRYRYTHTLCTWWKDLSGALPLDPPRPGGAVAISPVQSEETGTWARTVAAGFSETDAALTAEIDDWAVKSYVARAARDNCQSYLATISGEPAGGAVLEMRDGAALVRTASTRFAHRRKGVQSALIAERLRAASAAGCEAAFSMADKGGGSERNLLRFGFQLLQEGCNLERA